VFATAKPLTVKAPMTKPINTLAIELFIFLP
jgi:hypothetical protein